MIRGFSLFAMIRIMKMKDVELYNASVSKLDMKKVLCPCCKQNMKRHGSYDRELVVFDEEVKCEQISIVRFRCEECNITHGFFTENIVPYSNFSLFFTFYGSKGVHFVVKCGIKVVFSGNNAESEKRA